MGLPPLDSTKVVLTQHTQPCTRIVYAINAYHDRPNAVLRVRVVRLARSGYMAYDGSVPDLGTSSRRPVYYLERDFVVKTVLLGL